MKKGQIYEGIVESVDFPNKGNVFVDGQKVIVKNCIPGQKISFSIQKVRGGKAEGRLLCVLEPSPLESEPNPCPHFGVCGGCMYQSLPYEQQLSIKKNQVKKMLDEAIWAPYEFEGIKASPKQYGYRNKMEFSFGDEEKNGPMTLGMHKRGSIYDVVTVKGDEAIKMSQLAMRASGIFAGISSGAALKAALSIALNEKDKSVLAILPDTAERYLSGELFEKYRV